MFFPSRSRREGPDPWLEVKIALFTGGACLALAGMLLENRWLVTAAIAVLIPGLVLRFRRTEGDDARHADDEDED